MAKKYYAVQRGWIPGVYLDVKSAQKQTRGYPNGGTFKGFNNLRVALNYSKDEQPDKFKQKNSEAKTKESFPKKKKINRNLKVYVDGSYNYEKNIGGYGLVFVKNDTVIYEDYETIYNQDFLTLNNISVELVAAVRAVETAIAMKVHESVTIYYDYVGIANFLRKDVRNDSDIIMRYREKMLAYQNDIKIDFHRIRGHSGDEYHNMADRLAAKAAKI